MEKDSEEFFEQNSGREFSKFADQLNSAYYCDFALNWKQKIKKDETVELMLQLINNTQNAKHKTGNRKKNNAVMLEHMRESIASMEAHGSTLSTSTFIAAPNCIYIYCEKSARFSPRPALIVYFAVVKRLYLLAHW